MASNTGSNPNNESSSTSIGKTILALVLLLIIAGVVLAVANVQRPVSYVSPAVPMNPNNPTGYDSTSTSTGSGMASTDGSSSSSPTSTVSGGSGPTTIPDASKWLVMNEPASGVTFRYPATLGTTYVATSDWPPKISVESGPFTCAAAGSLTAPGGQTAERRVNGYTYCVTVESGAAAGSTYDQYAYAFPENGSVAVLTFTLQFPNCSNYSDDSASLACTTEEKGLNVDQLADQIVRTFQYKPVSSASDVVLSSVDPASGAVGSTFTISGSGFTADNAILFDGQLAAAHTNISASAGSRESITVQVPSSLSAYCTAGQACPMYARVVSPGTYQVSVANDNGTSGTVSFTVTGN